jgi:glycosyltransferase involved in cell wall biosynthesis
MRSFKGKDQDKRATPLATADPRPATEAKRLDDALFVRATDRLRSMRPDEPTISVVIPALNEADNLALVLPTLAPNLHEVLLVDGASDDGTLEVARRSYPGIRTIAQSGRGKGDALRTGFASATGDIIVMLDADGSASPAEIPAFVGALRSGADFAKGSRFLHGAGTDDITIARRFGNWVFVTLVRLLFGGRYSDLCYGYNAFWRDVLPALRLNDDGFEIEAAMNIRALKARLRVVEVASFERCRLHGASKLRTVADGWRVLKTIFRERFTRFPHELQPLLAVVDDHLVAAPGRGRTVPLGLRQAEGVFAAGAASPAPRPGFDSNRSSPPGSH